jgi:site-specific DNA-methyltransferase (adenine-specific)
MKPYYQDSAVTIYHGDCREIVPQLGRFDLLLTDPPYAHKHMDGGGFEAASRFYAGGALDGLNDFVLSDFADVLYKPSNFTVAFHSRDLVPDYAQEARSRGLKYDLHFWHKTNAIPFTANTWKSDVEYIALMWSKKPGWVQVSQEQHSKVYASSINTDRSHPAAKPIPLLKKYMHILGAQTILDPFAGSGTTGRAAKDLNKTAVLIEREEKYCEIAANRMAQEVLAL